MIESILNEKIVKRDEYIQKLWQYLDSPVVKVLTGMRRVGKSFILKSIIQEIVITSKYDKKNIFYINKEDLDFNYITNYLELNKEFIEFLKNVDPDKKIFVGIDEIQEIDGWEKFISSILAKYGKNIEIFITGSNSTMLSGELATYLTGRYIEFEIYPLSLKEYSLFKQEDVSEDMFLRYLKYGGLPGVLDMKQEDIVIFGYLRGVYSTIVLKDIVKHFGLRNIDFFENLYSYVFSNFGSIFSAKSISDYLKSQKIRISTETVLTYLNYGLKVYLLDLVKSVDPKTKKFFEIYNKYYVGDCGLRNSLVGFNLAKDIGSLLENYVFLELKRNGYNVKIGRLDDNKEIDFIAEKLGVTKYFQVTYKLASESTIEREYSSLESIKDNWEKYVISMDEMDFGIRNGIKHIKIYDLEKVL